MKAEMKNIKENRSLGAIAPNDQSFLVVLEKIVSVTNNVTHKLALILLFLLMILTSSDVVGRYFFNNPITGTYELTGLALAVMVFFSLGTTQLAKEHISIDFLINKFPPKIQLIMSCLSYFILLILLIATSWQLIKYTQGIWRGNELTADLGIPLYLFVTLSAIGMFCYTLTIFLDFVKSVVKVVEKDES